MSRIAWKITPNWISRLCKYRKCYPRWIIIGIDVTELIISSDSYVGRVKRNFTLLADQTVCHASSTSLLNLNCYLTIAPTGIPVTRLPSPPRTVFGTTTKSIPLHLRNETRKEIDSISLPRNPAFRFSFRMDGWMEVNITKQGGITLLLWLNLLWNRVERKGREGVSDGRDITNFCKMLPNSPVPWPRGIYIRIYIQWLNFLVALPWRRVISIGNLNKGFKERSLVVRPLPAPLLNIVFPPVAVSLPCSRQNSAPGATTRSPRIIHVATFHVASKSRDFATTHPSTPTPPLYLLFLRLSFSLLAGDVITIPAGWEAR